MAQTHVVHTRIDGTIKGDTTTVLAELAASSFELLVPTAATLQAMRDGREGKNMTPVTLDELRARVEGRQANAEDHSPP